TRVVLLTVLGAPRDEHGSGLRLGSRCGRARIGGGSRCVCRRGCGCRRLAACRCGIAAGLVLTTSTSATAGVARTGRGLLALELALGTVALVHPCLHTDAAEGGAGLEEGVVPEGAPGGPGTLSL